jgi:hypothetical protein
VTTTFPPGRYGHRRDPASQRRRRYLTYALAVIVAAAGLLIAVKLYRQYALAPYQVQVINVSDLNDRGVTVTFEVRKPAGQPAVCTVVARTRNGLEVGRAQVDVPAGSPDQTVARVTYTLATTARPMTGEVPGCGPAPGL